MKRIHPAERGFITTIFLLVVLAAIGGFMLTFSNTQHLTSAQDLQGSRAYWAANAGLEWGISSVINQPAATVVCPASPTSLPGGLDLFEGGFTVVVTCNIVSYSEGAKTIKILSLTSVAHNTATSGSWGFIERSLSVSIER